VDGATFREVIPDNGIKMCPISIHRFSWSKKLLIQQETIKRNKRVGHALTFCQNGKLLIIPEI
jgi:hypothetical protein